MTKAKIGRSHSMSSRWLLLITLFGLITNGACATQTEMNDHRELRSTLTLRETQSGFAGVRTTNSIIEPDGRFCRTSDLNGKLKLKTLSGRLDEGELARLAETLAENNVETLPEEYGRARSINPRTIVLSFKGRQSVFHLSPSFPRRQILPGDPATPLARIAVIRQAVISAIEAAPPAPSGQDCVSHD